MTRDLRRTVTVLTATVTAAVMVLGGGAATAGWTDATSSSSMPVSSGTLVAATSLTATTSCVALVARVDLAWTPTASAATGYRIYRKAAGDYALIATVSGRTTSSYLDAVLSTGTTYTYYVQAYVGSWTANSTTVTVATPLLCLI